MKLCRQCEYITKEGLTEDKRLNKSYTTQFIVIKAFKVLACQNAICPNIPNHAVDSFTNHNTELARLVMEKYCNTKLCYLSKKPNPQKCIRHIFNKLIHFKNQ